MQEKKKKEVNNPIVRYSDIMIIKFFLKLYSSLTEGNFLLWLMYESWKKDVY